ncbi:ribonuclease H family protein [Spelaeicoccus albus]|uniref:Ribonuclease H n=1 Tax=Spelaeicoccus albus TaxID=1280376 RepID=A0A7Z0IIL2_9MICO|nr:ribonuclease H [Spelaeicoccus albus]NYI68511.1 ribonuclease HI [Spelaeicoccus albus]
MVIEVAADGSALGNPGPAGWAWYVDEDCWAAGGWPYGTNNQGELTAVLELFRATRGLDEQVVLLCDSQYVIRSVTEWMPGWKRRGWRKSNGSPVQNASLMQAIDTELQDRNYRFEWVKGHGDHPLNIAADRRAHAAASAFQAGEPAQTGPGWTRIIGKKDSKPINPYEAPTPAATLFDDVDVPVTYTLELDSDESERLIGRAADDGVPVRQYLQTIVRDHLAHSSGNI